jgi:hypothetical protein
MTLRVESNSPSFHGIEGIIMFKHQSYFYSIFKNSNLLFNKFLFSEFMNIRALVPLFESFDNHFYMKYVIHGLIVCKYPCGRLFLAKGGLVKKNPRL